MKFTKENRVRMYYERKSGVTRSVLAKKYNTRMEHIDYTVRLIDLHGTDYILQKKNRKYSKSIKENAINRVLTGNESATSVALDIGLISLGTIFNWIRKYKENGYNVIEKKRGRKPMTKAPKNKPINKPETKDERLKKIEKENEYLRAENEFLKKWNSVVQQIEKQKKKK